MLRGGDAWYDEFQGSVCGEADGEDTQPSSERGNLHEVGNRVTRHRAHGVKGVCREREDVAQHARDVCKEKERDDGASRKNQQRNEIHGRTKIRQSGPSMHLTAPIWT
jgi:hypothetical protein